MRRSRRCCIGSPFAPSPSLSLPTHLSLPALLTLLLPSWVIYLPVTLAYLFLPYFTYFFLPSLISLSYFLPFSYSIFSILFFLFLPPFSITVHLVSNSLTFPHPPLLSFLALNVFASIPFLHRYVHLTFISFHLFLFPLHFTPPQFPLHCIYFPSFFLCFFFFFFEFPTLSMCPSNFHILPSSSFSSFCRNTSLRLSFPSHSFIFFPPFLTLVLFTSISSLYQYVHLTLLILFSSLVFLHFFFSFSFIPIYSLRLLYRINMSI